MGVMPMEIVETVYDRGYPHNTQALYVYCDTCGSFQIKKTTSVRQWFLLIGGFLFLYLLMYLQVEVKFFVLMLLYGGLAISAWGPPAYECKKCGAPTSTRLNTRRYAANNSLIDVPEEQIVKLYLSYWLDTTGDLEEYLMPSDENKSNDV